MGKQIWKPGTVLYPLPAVMVSCGDINGIQNIITIAWTGIVNSEPPMTYISVRPERYSYDIIKNSGEFVINLTTKKLTKACDFCGVRSGREIDKFKETGLTPVKSHLVKAPSIEQSPVNIECQVESIIPLGSHHMFLSKIVSVSVSDQYLDDTGKFHFDKSSPICYSHGQYYLLGTKLGKFGYSIQKKKNETKIDRFGMGR